MGHQILANFLKTLLVLVNKFLVKNFTSENKNYINVKKKQHIKYKNHILIKAKSCKKEINLFARYSIY